VALAIQNANQNNLVALDVGARQALVRIHLLGALRAISYLGEDLVPRGRKARAILGYLCLHAGQRVPRAKIAALLWDRVPDHQARASLRQSLRELLLAFGPLADEVLETDAEMIRLNQRVCWVDSAAILAGPHPANLLRTDLAALCEGELLEDLNGISEAFDEWLLMERARFATEVTAVFDEELHQIAQADVPAERRAGLARRIIACEPTHEGASRITHVSATLKHARPALFRRPRRSGYGLVSFPSRRPLRRIHNWPFRSARKLPLPSRGSAGLMSSLR